MGKLRSSRGCLRCRQRHIKCDETRPTCAQCLRRHELCRYDDTFKIVHQRPTRAKGRQDQSAREEPADTCRRVSPQLSEPNEGDSMTPLDALIQPSSVDRQDQSLSQSHADIAGCESNLPMRHFLGQTPDSSSPILPLNEQGPWTAPSPRATFNLQYADAIYLQHFASELGGWLDCTDAARQFTVKIPHLAQGEEILMRAVACFAARHMGQPNAAAQAHEQCVRLLIPRLTAADVASDDAVLCSIVILRVFEQLDVAESGTDQENHLTGCSALLQTSQCLQIDFDAPQLQHAAFWVYVRQAMYNACIYQHPPDLDLNVRMAPIPPHSAQEPRDESRRETSWSNAIVWLTAKIMRFCFQSSVQNPDQRKRLWHEFSTALDQWDHQKPSAFEPIWQDHDLSAGESPRFPVIVFLRDWHVMAFGFFHLARLLLVVYQPVVRFATQRLVGVKDANVEQVLHHARLICGVCQSNPDVVPSLITLCHTCFIWGPLLTQTEERELLVQLLQQVELKHSWPTAWITAALREVWTS